MLEFPAHLYPLGIRTFSEIRRCNYVYINKTDMIWLMTQMKYVFLCRPKRFGKSLLINSLDSHFKRKKSLYERLKIMDLETEWEHYPVIHMNLSMAKAKRTAEDFQKKLIIPQCREGWRTIRQ